MHQVSPQNLFVECFRCIRFGGLKTQTSAVKKQGKIKGDRVKVKKISVENVPQIIDDRETSYKEII